MSPEPGSIEKGTRNTEKPDSPHRINFLTRTYLLGPVKKDHGDLALLTCCLVTGMVDAASFSNWGVFVGMQTGNTVILGLSTAGNATNPYSWLTTMVSIASFLIGAYLTFHVTKVFAPKEPYSNRMVIVCLFLLQSLLVILAAALATPTGLVPQNVGSIGGTTSGSSNRLNNPQIVALVPPLAFQSGMQIASSRLLGYNELPVNVLTSTYCDIMGDYKLFALNNVKRNRRVAAVVLVLAGAVCSAWLMRSSGGLKSVLWVAGGIKLVVAAAVFCFMPAAELLRRVSSRQ